MKERRFSTKDYICIILSCVLFVCSILTVAFEMLYAAISFFCLFACITITLVQSVANHNKQNPVETEEYMQLKKMYDQNKKVCDVKIGLLTSKLEEGTREKKIITEKYTDAVEQLDDLKKNLQKTNTITNSKIQQNNKEISGEYPHKVQLPI